MINIKLLENDDIIKEGQWARPLVLIPAGDGHSDAYQTTNTYSGGQINNFKWLPITSVLGKCWFGKRLGDFNGETDFPIEVIEGDIPKSHILKE